MSKLLAVALACLGLPALAQTTTTVTSQPQQQANPPPPPSTTTVTTQSQLQPSSASTQVVVNPSDPNYVPPPRTTVRVDDDVSGVAMAPSGRSAIAIIAVDALYGGVAGGVIGGGVTLINQGDHWARNLMVGAGVGILAGAAYGVYEAATQPTPHRAIADADPATSNVNTTAFTAMSGRF